MAGRGIYIAPKGGIGVGIVELPANQLAEMDAVAVQNPLSLDTRDVREFVRRVGPRAGKDAPGKADRALRGVEEQRVVPATEISFDRNPGVGPRAVVDAWAAAARADQTRRAPAKIPIRLLSGFPLASYMCQ